MLVPDSQVAGWRMQLYLLKRRLWVYSLISVTQTSYEQVEITVKYFSIFFEPPKISE